MAEEQSIPLVQSQRLSATDEITIELSNELSKSWSCLLEQELTLLLVSLNPLAWFGAVD